MGTRPDTATWLAAWGAYQQASISGQLEQYRRRRWGRTNEFGAWLASATLPNLSPEQALALYRAGGGLRSAQFQTNPIEEVRDSLDFLLYDTIKLEGRFEECAAEGGAYKLAGAGKEFVSYLLCLRDPALFGVWNSGVERALRRLGIYPETLRQGHLGLGYLDLLEVLQLVRQHLGLPDFRAVDEFAHGIYRLGKVSDPMTWTATGGAAS